MYREATAWREAEGPVEVSITVATQAVATFSVTSPQTMVVEVARFVTTLRSVVRLTPGTVRREVSSEAVRQTRSAVGVPCRAEARAWQLGP